MVKIMQTNYPTGDKPAVASIDRDILQSTSDLYYQYMGTERSLSAPAGAIFATVDTSTWVDIQSPQLASAADDSAEFYWLAAMQSRGFNSTISVFTSSDMESGGDVDLRAIATDGTTTFTSQSSRVGWGVFGQSEISYIKYDYGEAHIQTRTPALASQRLRIYYQARLVGITNNDSRNIRVSLLSAHLKDFF